MPSFIPTSLNIAVRHHQEWGVGTVEVCKNCYLESEWIDKGLRYKSKQSPSPGTDDLFLFIL